jgi:glyoxylate reductase
VSPTFLLTLPLPEPAMTMLAEAGDLRVLAKLPSTSELAEALADGVDVLCSQLRDEVSREVLNAAGPDLKAVCNYAVGYDNVDVATASERGVYVTNTPGVLTAATADSTMGLILAAARRLCEGDAAVRAGTWDGWRPDYMRGMDLEGATLALIGFGRIGQAVAKRALAFDMRVLYVDDGWPTPPAGLRGAARTSFEHALDVADIVSIHAPLTPDTHHLIDHAALRAMKSTAVLVNTARGPIVDEQALVTALRDAQIAAAGLDVYEREPELAPGLRDCRNAVLAPHLGSATFRTRSAMARICATNALAAVRGIVPPNAVNA